MTKTTFSGWVSGSGNFWWRRAQVDKSTVAQVGKRTVAQVGKRTVTQVGKRTVAQVGKRTVAPVGKPNSWQCPTKCSLGCAIQGSQPLRLAILAD